MIEWLFPPRCPVCMQPVMPKGAGLHESCSRQMKPLEEPLCKRCGKPVEIAEEEYCPMCMVKDRVWDMGRSLYLYRGSAGVAIRKIKQEGTVEFVRFFGRQMKEKQGRFLLENGVECIVPVPLHKAKLRKRGFNQAGLLARALSRETGLPVRELLLKEKGTKDQKNLTLEQRRKNLSDVYRVSAAEMQKGLPEAVVLLDDIITTGSTLTACAKALKEAGVKRVYFLTVCTGE